MGNLAATEQEQAQQAVAVFYARYANQTPDLALGTDEVNMWEACTGHAPRRKMNWKLSFAPASVSSGVRQGELKYCST